MNAPRFTDPVPADFFLPSDADEERCPTCGESLGPDDDDFGYCDACARELAEAFAAELDFELSR